MSLGSTDVLGDYLSSTAGERTDYYPRLPLHLSLCAPAAFHLQGTTDYVYH